MVMVFQGLLVAALCVTLFSLWKTATTLKALREASANYMAAHQKTVDTPRIEYSVIKECNLADPKSLHWLADVWLNDSWQWLMFKIEKDTIATMLDGVATERKVGELIGIHKCFDSVMEAYKHSLAIKAVENASA